MSDAAAPAASVFARPEWRALEASHEDRVDALTAGHRARRAQGVAHPVEDFLFTYYHYSPARLRRWHPGPGVVLEGAAGMPRAAWSWYLTDATGTRMDVAGFAAARGDTVAFVRELLSRTVTREPRLGCFGLHEWAMLYRATDEEVRHAGWPLRLGRAGTDEVVESHKLRCTHFDAYRFFTPPALPRNGEVLSRAEQTDREQPGCLHAAMDLYKWSFKLAPLVPSDLTTDCFELAREVRELDMRASPYDLRGLGYEPIAVETPEGKAAYVAAQRDVARRGNALRQRLLAALAPVTTGHDTLDRTARDAAPLAR